MIRTPARALLNLVYAMSCEGRTSDEIAELEEELEAPFTPVSTERPLHVEGPGETVIVA